MTDFQGTINKWDIVVVPFPYIDIQTQKRRPALVISDSEFNSKTGLLWVLMITTSSEEWQHDVTITDLISTNLPAPSKIRCAKLATIEAKRITHVIGKLSENDVAEVSSIIRNILA